MRRLLVNDQLSALGEVTFWTLLREWFGMEFQGGDFKSLDVLVDNLLFQVEPDYPEDTVPSLIIRNASYFGPLKASETVPTISLLQDIFPDGPMREMQLDVMASSRRVVFNSEFTASQYPQVHFRWASQHESMTINATRVIPLPIDFSVFEPGNAMGLQQALSLPDGCVCWVGASQGAAGQVKGFDIFQQIVRLNPDIPFVGVFKDAFPYTVAPNLRAYCRLKHEELVKVIGACRLGLCTSRTESQHLAGIEMGACGLPLVVPNVGTYWNRKDWPGITVIGDSPAAYTTAIRARQDLSPIMVREFWKLEFDREVIRKQWQALVDEVEAA